MIKNTIRIGLGKQAAKKSPCIRCLCFPWSRKILPENTGEKKKKEPKPFYLRYVLVRFTIFIWWYSLSNIITVCVCTQVSTMKDKNSSYYSFTRYTPSNSDCD